MLKTIICRVEAERRAAFSRAQAAWSQLRSPGFLGQLGGWEQPMSHVACILAWWRSLADYRVFMAGEHDRIVAAAGQAGTYAAIEVDLWDEVLSVPGEDPDPWTVSGRRELLRLDDWRVAVAQVEAAAGTLRETWRPALAVAAGMRGGRLLCHREDAGRFLLVTTWSSRPHHDGFWGGPGRTLVPPPTAGPASPPRLVEIEPAWTVTP